jgi:hypothetical protein
VRNFVFLVVIERIPAPLFVSKYLLTGFFSDAPLLHTIATEAFLDIAAHHAQCDYSR